MAFLLPADLYQHIYEDIVSEIAREDASITTTALAAAEEEAKSYLSNYDVNTIFAATGSARNALLLMYCKDLAAWHIVTLGNPNIELSLREKRYDAAIRFLKDVQSGKAVPSLPPKPIDPENENSTGRIKWGSNRKRNNHY